jgi:hypothetical protein
MCSATALTDCSVMRVEQKTMMEVLHEEHAMADVFVAFADTDHLRPAAKQVIQIPDGHRFGFHNLRHALTSFLVEIGTDSRTIQDMLRWADPSILLKGLRALAHGHAHGGSGKDDRSHGFEREDSSTVHPVGVGDRPWVILPTSCRQISAKFFEMMVARDRVEPFCVTCYQ